jgi:adenylate cyclase, class 2
LKRSRADSMPNWRKSWPGHDRTPQLSCGIAFPSVPYTSFRPTGIHPIDPLTSFIILQTDKQMPIRNIEIKARSTRNSEIRRILNESGAAFQGEDHQTDTYFRVHDGRLKLREGRIENNLIHYRRSDQGGPKESQVTLFSCEPAKASDDGSAHPLKKILAEALGVLVSVRKKREIYFIGNVKFHIDMVDGLGEFVEIEAIDTEGTIGPEELRRQCDRYIQLFGIREEDLVAGSYSDMLMR